ncbi:hypothetical protein AVEN_265402-1 [Araneus ventricosus]|uniref:Uncharacterized protein n=1 Tax=Araneus ventricosus TaxID=182803 RepID=A0A4Y2HQY7_ARAVE|nr:hypothetical protein AVEN_265402-1 [Araneus ventricosus]
MDIISQADEIVELSKVIVRLGGFYLLMSYMGAVSKVMGGGGLKKMWYEIFTKNAVVHMANGHTYARVLRTHSLSQVEAHLTLEYCEKDGFLIGSGSIGRLIRLFNWF